MFKQRSRSQSAEKGAAALPAAEDPSEGDLSQAEVNYSTSRESLYPSDEESENLSFAKNHPLGAILIDMQSKLSKKSKTKQDDLENLSQKFKAAMDETNLGVQQQIDKQNQNFELALLEKELDYHKYNQAIFPPSYFSPNATLLTPSKLTEISKIIPKSSVGKFSGAEKSNPNVIEFLTNINHQQSILKMSEAEFKNFLLRNCTGLAYTLLLEYINYGHSISEIYANLMTLFDHRISSQRAREQLVNMSCHRNITLSELAANIMILGSRVASRIPPGESRNSVYNSETCSALIHTLPSFSSGIASNAYANLAAKLQAQPSFCQLIRALNRYTESINSDIKKNGSLQPLRNNYFERTNSSKINSSQKKELDLFSPQKYNKEKGNYPRSSRAVTRSYDDRKRSNYVDRPKRENFMDDKRKGKIRCTLCGGNHLAENGCYRMRDDNNKLIRVVPSMRPCHICKEKANETLYHGPDVCFRRKTFPSRHSKKLPEKSVK